MSLNKFTLFLASPLVLAACTSIGPDYERPELAALTPSSIEVDPAVTSISGEPAHDWYRRTGDPVLVVLVERAFQ